MAYSFEINYDSRLLLGGSQGESVMPRNFLRHTRGIFVASCWKLSEKRTKKNPLVMGL